jgi:hypothetical protein
MIVIDGMRQGLNGKRALASRTTVMPAQPTLNPSLALSYKPSFRGINI